MPHTPFDPGDLSPPARDLLSWYWQRQQELAAEWVERIAAIQGVEDELLSVNHGRLIAEGFLEFELQLATGGLRYQVTRAGRIALRTATGFAPQGENPAAELVGVSGRRAADCDDCAGAAGSQAEDEDDSDLWSEVAAVSPPAAPRLSVYCESEE